MHNRANHLPTVLAIHTRPDRVTVTTYPPLLSARHLRPDEKLNSTWVFHHVVFHMDNTPLTPYCKKQKDIIQQESSICSLLRLLKCDKALHYTALP